MGEKLKEIEKAMRLIISGVYVVTTRLNSKLNGLTVAWLSRASFSPPLISVSIGKTRYTHDLILKSRVLAVNILAEGQEDLARHFGFQSGKKVDKFAGLSYREAITGSPILEGVAAYLDCRVSGKLEAGDHTIFLAEVVEAEVDELAQPLIYRREAYFG